MTATFSLVQGPSANTITISTTDSSWALTQQQLRQFSESSTTKITINFGDGYSIYLSNFLTLTTGTVAIPNSANATYGHTVNLLPSSTFSVYDANGNQLLGSFNPFNSINRTGTISIEETNGLLSVDGYTSSSAFSTGVQSSDGSFVFYNPPTTETPLATYNLSLPQSPTTTTLVASSAQVTSGQSVTLTATESNGGNAIPTGTVTFYDGQTQIGQAATLDGNGIATLSTSSLAIGAHSITAVYSGDLTDAASTSSADTITVIPPTIATSLSIGNATFINNSLSGDPIFTSVAGDSSSVNVISGSGYYGGINKLISISDLVSLSSPSLQTSNLQTNGEQVLPEVALNAAVLASFINPNAGALHYEFVSGLTNGASISLSNSATITPYLTDVAIVNSLSNASATVDISNFGGVVVSGLGVNVTGLTTGNHLIAAGNAAYNFGAGNQTMDLAGGNAIITGGAGVDTVILQGEAYFPLAINTIINGSNTATQIWTSHGVSTLVNIDYLQFGNQTIAIDVGIGQNAGEAYRLYQAAFHRTPDQAGLDNWITQLDKGAALQSIAQSFINSAEFTATYGSNLSNAAFVNALYSNVLHRAPDAAGNAYWLGQLSNGANQAQILSSFSESVENAANVADLIGHGVVHQMVA